MDTKPDDDHIPSISGRQSAIIRAFHDVSSQSTDAPASTNISVSEAYSDSLLCCNSKMGELKVPWSPMEHIPIGQLNGSLLPPDPDVRHSRLCRLFEKNEISGSIIRSEIEA